jgi:hypothetical protein
MRGGDYLLSMEYLVALKLIVTYIVFLAISTKIVTVFVFLIENIELEWCK